MTALTEEDRKKAHEATNAVRNDINQALETLYILHDTADMSQPLNQTFTKELIGTIGTELDRLDLISKTLSANNITQDDEKKLEEINLKYHSLATQLTQTSQDVNKNTMNTWASLVEEQKNKNAHLGVSFP